MKSSWMVVAGLLFAIMGVFVKLGSAYFTSAELVFYRSAIGLVVIFAIVRTQKLPLATPHVTTHVWRGLSGFFALMLFFYAISALPLATAITLNYTAPLFLAILLTLFLKEKMHWELIGAVLLGFSGVVLLLRPTFESAQASAGLMGLVSGFLAGIAYFNVNQLGKQGEPEWRVVFYFTLVATLGAGAWMLVHSFHPVGLRQLPILLGLGASATLAQLAMTRAYRLGKPLVVGSLAYATVVFASLFGILLWGEWLDKLSWLGMGLIVASGIFSVLWTPRASVSIK
jgi:drug/metabolite transporter (DMT)-like permease